MSITRYLCPLVSTAATMQVFAQAPADANQIDPVA
jgi:hypothetical protein